MPPRSPKLALVTYALRCGGVATFLFRLGGYLRGKGWSVDLITTEEKGDWFGLAAAYGLEAHHIDGVDRRSRVAHAGRVGDFLAGGGYDAVLLNHSLHAQMALGKLPDSTLAVPIVHGDDPFVYAVACSNRHAWNVLVAPGPKLCAVAQLEAPDRPVVMIPHGVPVPGRETLRIEGRAHEPFRIAFVGRLDDSHKNLSLLPEILRACERHGCPPDLRIAGNGPDDDRLRRMVREAGLEERVRFLGPLKPADVYRLLLDSHALLFPSSREGFGMVTLEAQACGCVPVCSNLPGVTDAAVEDRRTGYLIPPGDAEGFAEAIAELSRDRSRWSRFSAAGHAAVAEHFSLERMGSAYHHLLLMGRNNRYPLWRPRRWRRPLDLTALPGSGFLVEGVRRLARWWRGRRTR